MKAIDWNLGQQTLRSASEAETKGAKFGSVVVIVIRRLIVGWRSR
jgi:hypothetical protein